MSDVTMPQLGESVTEGTITRWFKQPGEEVAEDEILLEVSTDKVDTEVPSPVAGTVQELRVDEGDTVDVGTVIAVVGEGAASSGGNAAPQQDAAAEPAPQETAAAQPAASAKTPDAGPPQIGSQAPSEPPAAAPSPPDVASPPDAASQGADTQPVAAPAHGAGQAEAADVAPQAAPAAATDDQTQQVAPTGAGPQRSVLLSPQVRRLLADAAMDASDITGTGVGGRITREDAIRAIEARRSGSAAPAPAQPAPAAAPAPQVAPAPPTPAAEPPAAAPAARGSSVPTPAAVSLGAGDTRLPFSNIRRRTGDHMVASKAASPHVITAVEVDYEAVEAARQQFGAEYKASEGHSLTYLPFIARAAVDAISDFPFINASVDGDALVVHRDVNLSVAVDLNFEGLLAPVLHQADALRLHAIARDIANLAQRARSKQLGPDDLVGGTFTLSNSGSFGALFVAPVINQPQVAILSTDGISRRPVAVSDGRGHESIAIHSVGNLTMSWDHRAFDGAYAAAFLARMKEILQTRDWAAEL